MPRPDDSVLAALAVLGLGADADRDQVTAAYRRLARTTHPDLCDAPDAAARFAVLVAAYHKASGVVRADDGVSADVVPAAPREPVRSAASIFMSRRPVFAAGPVHVEPPTARDGGTGSATAER